MVAEEASGEIGDWKVGQQRTWYSSTLVDTKEPGSSLVKVLCWLFFCKLP